MTCITEMPALKMKSKSSTDCVRGHNLHACRKSIKASKCLRSQVKTSQQTAALDNSVQNLPDACSNIEVSCQHVEITEVDVCPDILSGTSSQLLKLPSSAIDPLSSVTMGSPSVICSTNLETIFSPNFEHDESHFKMINHDDSVRNEQAELPHLVADDSDDGSCSSSDFQAYHELDFYISDNVAVSPFDRDMGFIDIENTISRDFESMNHDMIIDMTDRYMIPPYLEKPVETSNICNEDSFDGAMNSDDVCLYLSIHQMKSDQETEISGFLDDLEEIEYIDQQLVFRNLPVLSEAVSSVCPILSQKETQKRKLVTLVLDLDETLVHSTLEHCNDADFTFTVFFNMKHHTVYVRRRPYLQMFLEKVAQMFEVIIFTASQSIYAEQLLDELDPDRNLITQRIYRESCIFSEGSYTKDLTVLGVDLAKVAIVDNSPQVFRLQVNNGIPIESWFDDPSDHALISLLPFLETLVDADDVRPIIAGRFGNDCLVSH